MRTISGGIPALGVLGIETWTSIWALVASVSRILPGCFGFPCSSFQYSKGPIRPTLEISSVLSDKSSISVAPYTTVFLYASYHLIPQTLTRDFCLKPQMSNPQSLISSPLSHGGGRSSDPWFLWRRIAGSLTLSSAFPLQLRECGQWSWIWNAGLLKKSSCVLII